MFVMMFATQFEASTSTRAMKHYIYGSAWFDAGVYLFVVNIVVNTLRRRPFGFRHAGFLTVHSAILMIVAGGLMTRYLGTDGTMPIPEGGESRSILLPDSDLVVEFDGRTTRVPTHFDLQPWKPDQERVVEIPGTSYALRIDRYFPSAAVTDTLLEESSGQGPIVQVALGTGETEPTSGWLLARDPAQGVAQVGSVTLRFVESPALAGIRETWAKRPAPKPAPPAPHGPAGTLQLVWADGGMETITVPSNESRVRTTRAGVDVHVDQIFRAFVLTDTGFADGEGAAENPALRFHLVDANGPIEEHFSFTHFPEFRATPPEGKEHRLSHALWMPTDHAHGAPLGEERELVLEWREPGTIVTHTSWKDTLDGAPIGVGETRAFTDAGLLLRVLQAAPDGRVARTVTKISDEVENPVLHVRLEERDDTIRHAGLFDFLRGEHGLTPAAIDPNRAWVFHGSEHAFATPEGPLTVRYESRTIPLPFGIRLDDFVERRYPGIETAASYESHVQVVPTSGDPFAEKIHMNHPLKYGGYTFYQASFQRTPEGEITVLSVAKDPGMTFSFFGYCVLVAGLLVIFFVKPYLRRLDDRIARARAAALGGTT
jgi:hypothetical protein